MNTSEEFRSRFRGYSTETSVSLATVIRRAIGRRKLNKCLVMLRIKPLTELLFIASGGVSPLTSLPHDVRTVDDDNGISWWRSNTVTVGPRAV